MKRSAIAFAWGARTGVRDADVRAGEHRVESGGEPAVQVADPLADIASIGTWWLASARSAPRARF